MLLIVASELDPHADAVILALRERGFAEVLRVDLETAHRRFDVAADPGDLGSAQLRARVAGATATRLAEVRTIWWRRASGQTEPLAGRTPTLAELDAAEAATGLRWLLESLPAERFPLGTPSAHAAAGNKLRQLGWAAEVGLRVPATLWATQPTALTEFARRYARVVVKPLRSSLAVRDAVTREPVPLAAVAVDAPELLARLADAAEPVLYCQECVDKVADVRLTLLPGRTVACRIDTADLPAGEIDWRPTTWAHAHAIVEPPTGLEAAARAYLRRAGLTWGAMDFAVTAAGDWVFLECNPNGQWLWVELKTGAPLARAFADVLADHHAASAHKQPTDDQLTQRGGDGCG